MLNESVINVLKNGMWDLATCANGEPNVVPVAFKDIAEDGKLVVGDVFLETTFNNIKENDIRFIGFKFVNCLLTICCLYKSCSAILRNDIF